jgi:hypothetical protein
VSPRDVTIVLETETHLPGSRLAFPDALDGIAAQTSAERILEVLVVSARPPEDSEARALARFPLPIRWIERAGGRYYDLKNAGIEQSRGSIVVLSDSDTRMAPDFVERTVALMADADPSVAALTGRTRYLPGPFSRELAVAQLPNQLETPGATLHFLAHNVAFRGDVIRAHLFHRGFIRLYPDTELARRLIAEGRRILYRPELGVTHNFAKGWREMGGHCLVIGYHDARHRDETGERPVGALRDAVGRFRLLAGRLLRLRRAMGISRLRVPVSLAFLAWYAAAVGSGYAAFRRGRPEPFGEF